MLAHLKFLSIRPDNRCRSLRQFQSARFLSVGGSDGIYPIGLASSEVPTALIQQD